VLVSRPVSVHVGSCFQSVERSPTNRTAHLGLAQLAIRSGDVRTALEHLVEVFRESRHAATQRGWRWSQEEASLGIDAERALAILLDDSGLVESAIADMSEDARSDARLMMAIWTGRWNEADAIVTRQLGEAPFDPTLWWLQARCKEQLGDVAGSLEALLRMRRLEETTLRSHRSQLELTLAGKQVQEAAAGSRQGQTGQGTTQQQFAGATGYSPYAGYGSQVDEATQRLASLSIRLGRFEEAERLFLAQSLSARSIPSIADLMWKQGERGRALELMHLAMITSDSASGYLEQYTGMLAEAGQHDRAIDILERAYRYASGTATGSSAWYFGYYSGASDDLSLENSDERRISRALHVMLDKSGRLDESLARYEEHLASHPEDDSMLRLAVSLLQRAGRWEETQRLLRKRLEMEDDPALAVGLFEIDLQLRESEVSV